MKKQKTQMQRIIDCFVTSIIIIVAAILISSGIAISKINTDYLESGVRAGKIVAERKAQQISVTTHEGITLSGETNPEKYTKILAYLPPPVNTAYMLVENVTEIIESFSE